MADGDLSELIAQQRRTNELLQQLLDKGRPAPGPDDGRVEVREPSARPGQEPARKTAAPRKAPGKRDYGFNEHGGK